MEDLPSSSISNQDDLQELKNIGVQVWGQQQTILEEQALGELKTFNDNLNKENNLTTNANTDTRIEPLKEPNDILDITSYIKRQDELKKRQEYMRSLAASDRNTVIANQINQKNLKTKSKRKNSERHKRKYPSDNNNHDNKTITTDIKEVNQKEILKVEESDKSGSEYVPSDIDSDYEPGFREDTIKKIPAKKIKLNINQSKVKYEKVIDDGDSKCYEERLNQYYKKLEEENQNAIANGLDLPETEIVFKNNLKCSSKIWNALYSYQQTGVEWLWEMHNKSTGGLLGDEMGLGKTVEVIAFLYSLNYTRPVSSYGGYKGLGPTLIVCPSTVIHQWVKHFHDWAPEFRVSILHQSGTFNGNKYKLIKENIKSKGILITTYQSMLKYQGILTEQCWHYIILDEGHKIRNPGAKISVAVKKFKTPHRLLLTGSPMQNNLTELWSLFDFVNPGMLGTLEVFMEHFANPIMQGGYSNATPMQEALALSMATALKQMITQHLLRRSKSEVKTDIQLPNKSEQVLFCSITPEQRDLYKGYLLSDHVSNILGRGSKNWFSENHTRANVLMSITTLRKICNHPDIYLQECDDNNETKDFEENFGSYKRSGKMIVVAALLKMWKKQGHRVLLFTQSRAMLSIFERFLSLNDYKYLKMDGATSIGSRQPLIDKFNNDTSCEVFLLTTRVGGLGVNLTGANRVIIYDPDWNPATDTQARERAWRIGQDREVTIYRLLSAGTIEEKIYQRQIWKQLLSNKVLLDPKTQRFFKSSDLHDLFSLQEHVDSNPETTNIFQNSRISLEEKLKNKKKKKSKTEKIKFSEDKIEKMKQLAAQIAKTISKTTNSDTKLDSFQKELKEEREIKLKDRQELKKLTPVELLQYNREKLSQKEEDGNKLDDCETDVNFTKALVISEQAADLYIVVKGNSKKVDEVTEHYKSLTEVFSKNKKTKMAEPVEEDFSGSVEGEVIEGIVKRQTKKIKINKKEKKEDNTSEKEDDYILGKLFAKKGVQSALKHDNIVQCTPSESSSIRVQTETQMRTDLALQALRKSRLSRWKW